LFFNGQQKPDQTVRYLTGSYEIGQQVIAVCATGIITMPFSFSFLMPFHRQPQQV